jgi:hypothetical protein
MRLLRNNNQGSIDPVIYLFICIGLASITVLILGEVLVPFFQLMDSTDDSIDSDISAPRGYFSSFVHMLWPKGVLLVVFIGCIFAMIMTYQKKRYKEMI